MEINLYICDMNPKEKEMCGCKVAFVNATMKDINEKTDNIYEELMSNNSSSLNAEIDSLIIILKDIKVANYL